VLKTALFLLFCFVFVAALLTSPVSAQIFAIFAIFCTPVQQISPTRLAALQSLLSSVLLRFMGIEFCLVVDLYKNVVEKRAFRFERIPD